MRAKGGETTVRIRRGINSKRESKSQSETEKEKSRIELSLRERGKELNCLYGIAELIERYGSSIEDILQGIADLLPPSWRYPDVTCARIVLDDHVFVTANFTASPWKQTAHITTGRRVNGVVEVHYLEEMPHIYEGPFLKEERRLIDAVAERIGRVFDRITSEQQLENKRISLENKNVALREILDQVKEDDNKMGVRIRENVERAIMPVLYALEGKATPAQLEYIRLLKRNLEEITAPFISNLSKEFSKLTPVEIQICNLIKNGFSSKEVAQVRGISVATVNRHREHIRRKLGVANRKVNLVTYLHTFMTE